VALAVDPPLSLSRGVISQPTVFSVEGCDHFPLDGISP
jgi:hypothetical protein